MAKITSKTQQVNLVEVKFVWQTSNPPANGARQGNYFASPEIIEVKIRYRQTDRQTDKFFDTIYGGVWIFSSS